MKDPELLAEAKKGKMDMAPSSGEELQALTIEVMSQPQEVIEGAKKSLGFSMMTAVRNQKSEVGNQKSEWRGRHAMHTLSRSPIPQLAVIRSCCRVLVAALLIILLRPGLVTAAELPVVRIAPGAFNEKVAALWVAAEQGFYRKHGVNVEVINIYTGPQTMAAIASGDIQIAYTIPGAVLSTAAAGMDAVFFGGIVSRADGDSVVAPNIHRVDELKGKKLGVQSIGAGVCSFVVLTLKRLELEPDWGNTVVAALGDRPVLSSS